MLKQHKDNEGRIVCVEAKIMELRLIYVIYMPQIKKSQPKVNKMMGDYNQVQDGVLDKMYFTSSVPRDRRAIHLMMRDLGLMDIWRLVHPRDREYTFYSNMHKSHSRSLISKDLVEGTVDCSIGPIALMDHANVQWGVNLGSDIIESNRWRINVSLLQDETFTNLLGEYLKMCLTLTLDQLRD